jgi:two-component system response regulator DevR
MTSAPPSQIRILIVEDSPLVRSGIRAAIESDPTGAATIQIAGEASTVASAVALAREQAPDVILLDLRLPDGSGLTACREILKDRPQTHVLVLTSLLDDHLAYDSVVSGAHGFLTKDIDPASLVQAITAAAAGRPVFSPQTSASVLMHMRSGAPSRPSLSHQEKRVMAKVAEGLTNKEVGRELGLSENTVKNYLGNAFEKLGVSRRSQAVARFLAQERKA